MDAGNRRKEDSGLIDIDALMREANASAAVPAAPLRKEEKKPTLLAPPKSAPRENEPRENAPPKNAPPTNEGATLDSTPALVTRIPVAPRVPTRTSRPKTQAAPRSFTRPIVAVGVAMALLGGGLYRHLKTTSPAAASVVVTAPREHAVAPPRALEASNETAQPAAPSANDLPTVASASSAVPIPTAPTTATPTTKRAAPTERADAVVTTTELIPGPPTQDGDLGRAMHDAVGDGSSRVAKVDGAQRNDARTLRPSPGAVIGALNAVLPAARACLGPDDAIRVGMVTFRSDGTVAKIDLNGKRESDECIRSAVSRARVEPFTDDAFTTRVTVRP